MSPFAYYHQQFNIALSSSNDSRSAQMLPKSNVDQLYKPMSCLNLERTQQASIVIVRAGPPPHCTRNKPILDAYWSTAEISGIAVCSACYETFISASPVAHLWNLEFGLGATCDMSIAAVRDSWQDLIEQAQNSSLDVGMLVHHFDQRYCQIMHQINNYKRHIEALESIIQSLKPMAPWNPAIPVIVNDKNIELGKLRRTLEGLTGLP